VETVAETAAIGSEPEECFGVEEIWATKAPRTMAREAITKRSFQPWDFETLKWIEFRVWVVMAFSVPRRGFENLLCEWRQGPGKCDATWKSIVVTGAWRFFGAPLRHRLGSVGYSAGEEVHVGVAVDLASRQLVMDSADQPTVLHGRRAAASPRNDVVDLEPRRGTAHAAPVHGPLAFPAVPGPDRSLHRGGHVVRLRRTRVLLRLLHLRAPPCLLLQQ
jgi:hypothetical protein